MNNLEQSWIDPTSPNSILRVSTDGTSAIGIDSTGSNPVPAVVQPATAKPFLLGLAGKKRSGKDTVYCMITSADERFIVRRAFADALKEEVAAACGVSLQRIDRLKARFRPMLQWWGSEFRRGLYGENYWLEVMADRLHDDSKAISHIITDVRFPNEADFVRKRGGFVVRVDRPVVGPLDDHPSETALDGYRFDWVIPNTGTLEDLRREVSKMCAALLI